MINDDLREHQQFAMKIEQAIRKTNREILHPIVDPLTEEKVLSVAIEVAKRRAAYVELTLKMGVAGEHELSGEKLRNLRLKYEEGRDAFAELMTAIERGHIDLPAS